MMEKWGLKLHPKLVELTGRVLPREQMVFASGTEMADEKADWTKAFRCKYFFRSLSLSLALPIVLYSYQ